MKKLAVSLRSKAETLLAASSGASVAIEGSLIGRGSQPTRSPDALGVGSGETEAWLDQVIATTDGIRHENQTLEKLSQRARKMAEDAFEAAQAVAPTLKERTIDASLQGPRDGIRVSRG